LADTGLTLAEWRAGAPELAEQVAEDWGLRLGDEYAPGICGHVVRAELPDGTATVLKVQWPHRESLQEADALERWNGDGAVRLLAQDGERSALLLERCEPGTCLSSVDAGEALDVLIGLLPRLWKNAEGFATIEDEVPYLLEDLEQARHPRLKDAALACLRELVPTQGERALVNVDLHGANVLSAQREPWLVIDPKPIAAERELGAASIVRSNELGHSKRDVLYRLDRLCADLGLDRERVLAWTVAHTVAWSGLSEYDDPHLEAVRWLLEGA
jgi:streptomycin 6-kinase